MYILSVEREAVSEGFLAIVHRDWGVLLPSLLVHSLCGCHVIPSDNIAGNIIMLANIVHYQSRTTI